MTKPMTDADKIKAFDLINELRTDELESVEICHDNPDFNGLPDCLIFYNYIGSEMEMVNRRFAGDTVLECLEKAIEFRNADN